MSLLLRGVKTQHCEEDTQAATHQNYLLNHYEMIVSFKSQEVIRSALPVGEYLLLHGGFKMLISLSSHERIRTEICLYVKRVGSIVSPEARLPESNNRFANVQTDLQFECAHFNRNTDCCFFKAHMLMCKNTYASQP